MKGYLSIREAAEKWGVSERRVNQYCAEGRIHGVQRFGTSWAIPDTANKPGDPRKNKTHEPPKTMELYTGFMPLMSTSFAPGNCMETIEKIPNGPKKEIALAEYYYFSGQAEKAMQKAELYLTYSEAAYRLSACLIYVYACLSMGQISHARYALNEIKKTLADGAKQAPHVRAIEAFVASASAVLLHLPLPEEIPSVHEFLPLLPPGLRAFALYVLAHYLYLKEDYSRSAGIVEATLAMGGEEYPIPAIYLHLVAVMDYMSLRERKKQSAICWPHGKKPSLMISLRGWESIMVFWVACWKQSSNQNGQKISNESSTSHTVSLRDGVEFITPLPAMMWQTI